MVGILESITGRVVVTGMGKSGHVGRKISATLASTGTPSFFVHPGEASHGDLGMITQHDAVLALSNSGETPELRDLTIFARRFSIPLIAMVGKGRSTLAETADAALVRAGGRRSLPHGPRTNNIHNLHDGARRRTGRGSLAHSWLHQT